MSDKTIDLNDPQAINILDVVAFFWTARWYVLSGCVVGALVSWYIGGILRPPVYKTFLSIKNQKVDISHLNEFLSDRDIQNTLAKNLGEAPAVKSISASWSEKFSKMMKTGFSVQVIRGPNPTSLFVETHLPFPDPDFIYTTSTLDIVNKLIDIHNHNRTANSPALKSAKQAEFENARSVYLSLSLSKLSESKDAYIKLEELQSILCQNNVPDRTTCSKEFNPDYMQHLLLMAYREQKIPKEKFDKLFLRTEELMSELEVIRIKFDQSLSNTEALLKTYGKELIQIETLSLALFPQLEADLEKVQENRDRTAVESKAVHFILFGSTFGIFLGLLARSLVIFAYTNRSKLKLILQSN